MKPGIYQDKDEEWIGLNPKVKNYWIIKGVLIVTLLILCCYVPFAFTISTGVFIAILVFLLLISYFIVIIWSVLFYERYIYRIQDDGVYINRGIWFKSNRVIPYERMQHVAVTRGPLEIIYGIYDLNIFTAGTGSMGSSTGSRGLFGAEGFIPGLSDPEPLQQEIWGMIKRSKPGSGLGDDDRYSPPSDAMGPREDAAVLQEIRRIRQLIEKLIIERDGR